jgi:hypothetical protein
MSSLVCCKQTPRFPSPFPTLRREKSREKWLEQVAGAAQEQATTQAEEHNWLQRGRPGYELIWTPQVRRCTIVQKHAPHLCGEWREPRGPLRLALHQMFEIPWGVSASGSVPVPVIMKHDRIAFFDMPTGKFRYLLEELHATASNFVIGNCDGCTSLDNGVPSLKVSPRKSDIGASSRHRARKDDAGKTRIAASIPSFPRPVGGTSSAKYLRLAKQISGLPYPVSCWIDVQYSY